MALVIGTTCGFVTVAPIGDPGATSTGDLQNDARGNKFTSPVGATNISEIGIYIDNSHTAADFGFGLYSHNVGDDEPEALLGSVTGTTDGSAGWLRGVVDIDIDPETIYWIVIQVDGTGTLPSLATDIPAAGESMAYKLGQTELPSPYGTPNGVLERLLSIYALVTAPPGTNIQINIADAWKDVDSIQINIGDVWKDVIKIQQNIGDAWKTVFG